MEHRHSEVGKGIGFGAVVLTIFTFLLFSGWHTLTPGPPEGPSLLQRETTLTLRQDSVFPNCDGLTTLRGVRGQLVRAEKARIIGLSDVHQVGDSPGGGLHCEARVNLDFGTQPIDYTIRRVGAGQQTWELRVLPR